MAASFLILLLAISMAGFTAPSRDPSPSPPAPFFQRITLIETETIPFQRITRNDPSLPQGDRLVQTRGADGERELTYEVALIGGKQTSKRLIRSEVIREPVDEVTLVGTEAASSCDPNYSGCVPIASDVDCQGGRGNGPAYVRGPVRVVGDDIYGLDGDGDGIGCE